jgi:hypothetical protein
MLLCRRLFVGGLGFLAMPVVLVVADDKAPATKQSGGTEAHAAPGENDSVAKWIEQLDAPEFHQREAACAKLVAKGKEAIPALEKAAATGDLEVSSRAATILGKLLKSSDEATENAALKALRNLADCDSPAAARKAQSMLNRQNGMNDGAQIQGAPGGGIVIQGNNGFGGRIIINGGQLNLGGPGLPMKSVSVSTVNGVKEISTTEGVRSVKIKDDPANGISIDLTEEDNGKTTTKKYQAKDVDDLKKNHPAGYELFKKYGGVQQGNAAQMNIQGGINVVPAKIFPTTPVQVPAKPIVPGEAILPAQSPQVEVATIRVRSLSLQFERLQKSDAYKSATPEAKARLKKEIEELSKRLEDVRGQLGSK